MLRLVGLTLVLVGVASLAFNSNPGLNLPLWKLAAAPMGGILWLLGLTLQDRPGRESPAQARELPGSAAQPAVQFLGAPPTSPTVPAPSGWLEPVAAPTWMDGNEWVKWGSPNRQFVVGESFRQAGIKKLLGVKPSRLVTVKFTREPGNKHDRWALKATVGRTHVGYLDRETARRVAPLMDGSGVASFELAGRLNKNDEDGKKMLANVDVWAAKPLTRAPVLK